MRTPEDKFVDVNGLRLRYIEAGEGPAAIFLHGGSLGSSADVFIRNIKAFAAAGVRAIAFDQPGFGLSETPADHSAAFRRRSIEGFRAALGLDRAALVAHSQAGSMAVQLALESPALWSHVAVLGTGSLLPPLSDEGEGRDAAAQVRLERRMATEAPTLEDTRKLLQANLYHHELITDDELALRHARSLGPAFAAFVARSDLQSNKTKGPSAEKPLWQRLVDLQQPLILLYGAEDRANAAERATKLKGLYPQLDLHIVSGCKHLVPWDAEQDVARLVIPFLKR